MYFMFAFLSQVKRESKSYYLVWYKIKILIVLIRVASFSHETCAFHKSNTPFEVCEQNRITPPGGGPYHSLPVDQMCHTFL